MLDPIRPVNRRILAAGDLAETDPTRVAWYREAQRHMFDCEPISFETTGLDENCLILVSFGLKSPVGALEQVIRTDSQKVIYLPPGGRELAADKAIEYCRHNRVCGVIAGSPVLDRRMKELRRRLRNLFLYGTMYEPIRHRSYVPSGSSCFIATAFEEDEAAEFEEGVEAAMNGLGLKICNPRTEIQLGRKITDKVRGMIQDAKILVANIRSSRKEKEFNPNVFYEIGFSQALDDRIILPYRRAGDERQVPIDIRDGDYFEYEDAMDLAMQLYWGLKPLVTPRADT